MAKDLLNLEKEFDNMRKQINSLMGGFFDENKSLLGDSDLKVPISDIIDDGNQLKATIEIPGVNKEDIKLSVNNQTLYVEAEHNYSNEDKKDGYSKIERSYTGFKRAIPLDVPVDEDNIKANYNNGVLEVHMPKQQIENKDNVKYIDIS